MPTPEVTTWETVSLFGVKLMSLVFAFVGAGLGIANSPTLTARQSWAAMVAGLVCGAMLPELVTWGAGKYLGVALPMLVNNLLAVLFGMGGMFIVPGIIVWWRDFATDPWGWWDKLVARLPRRGSGQ